MKVFGKARLTINGIVVEEYGDLTVEFTTSPLAEHVIGAMVQEGPINVELFMRSEKILKLPVKFTVVDPRDP